MNLRLRWILFRILNFFNQDSPYHVNNDSWLRYKTVYSPGFCDHPYPMTDAQECWAILNRMQEKLDESK